MKGKVCFVAGGTGGLGLSIARAFAELGAVVIVASSRPERLADAAEVLGTERCLPIDVTDERSIRGAFERTVERHVRLDVMINAAGSSLASRPWTWSSTHGSGCYASTSPGRS